MIVSLARGPALLPGHGHIAATDHTLPPSLTGQGVTMIRGRHVNGHRLSAGLRHLLDGVEPGVSHEDHALHTLTQGVQAGLLAPRGPGAGLVTSLMMASGLGPCARGHHRRPEVRLTLTGHCPRYAASLNT